LYFEFKTISFYTYMIYESYVSVLIINSTECQGIPLQYFPVTDVWDWVRASVTQLQGEVLQRILALL